MFDYDDKNGFIVEDQKTHYNIIVFFVSKMTKTRLKNDLF